MTEDVGFARKLFVAFGTVAIAIVCGALYASWVSYRIETRTTTLASNALPSIDHLTAACDGLRDLEATSDDYPDLSPEKQAAAREDIEKKWRAVEAELSAYVRLPVFPGEADEYQAEIPPSFRAVNTALSHLFDEVEAHDVAAARLTADREVRVAASTAASRLRKLVRLNTSHAYEEVDRIASEHSSAARHALILDALAVLLTLIATLWVLRLFRAHDRLLQAHTAVVERRADELELFGKRVAHDLLSPLSALTYCLNAFRRVSENDPKLLQALVRARACVTRAQVMVDGIFEFSRSGGRPETSERADLKAVLDQVTDDVRMADVPPEIVVERFEPHVVACSAGVLTSVLGNLVRNAAKFMSDSELRRITVRVRDDGPNVRVEIEDTGPGFPQGMESAIFEPYVRAEGVTQPGLGLGLATVKRLCEAHGGSVGARSTLGRGATFWFTLPSRAQTAELSSQAQPALFRVK
jgi:signal transduction histidine kinase